MEFSLPWHPGFCSKFIHNVFCQTVKSQLGALGFQDLLEGWRTVREDASPWCSVLLIDLALPPYKA